jgi:hypothetical protein
MNQILVLPLRFQWVRIEYYLPLHLSRSWQRSLETSIELLTLEEYETFASVQSFFVYYNWVLTCRVPLLASMLQLPFLMGRMTFLSIVVFRQSLVVCVSLFSIASMVRSKLRRSVMIGFKMLWRRFVLLEVSVIPVCALVLMVCQEIVITCICMTLFM